LSADCRISMYGQQRARFCAPEQGNAMAEGSGRWADRLYDVFKAANVRLVPYVPDAGHAKLIERIHAGNDMRGVVLTTEEEGIAVSCGAWLGGQRSVLLMQSSGVGNCINMLSLVENCRFPLVALVTMRGEWAEFNQWQVPMGRATQKALELMGVTVQRAETVDDIGDMVAAGLDSAFKSDQSTAILLSQRLIGRKTWTK
jgi:sulfopyruvate decarboxylase alpha subunit